MYIFTLMVLSYLSSPTKFF